MRAKLLLFVVCLSSCSDDPAKLAPSGDALHPVQLQTAVAAAIRYTPEIEVTGSLEPIASVQLGFDVPGRLSTLLVKRGQQVDAGQPLARLDAALAGSQLAQAEAGLAAARAQYDIANSSVSRLDKLGDAVSIQQKAEADAGKQSAKAATEQAEAAVKMAKTNLAFHTLRSPIAGVVTAAPDNPGMMIGAGTPLFVIEDLSALRMKTSIPETESWIAAGQKARVMVGIVEAPAIVERVLPSLDPSTRRLPIELRLDTPPETLRAHAFARAIVLGPEQADGISIPPGALVARPDFSVLVQESSTNVPRKVPVTVVSQTPEQVIVRGALQNGETVVVNPPHGYGE